MAIRRNMAVNVVNLGVTSFVAVTSIPLLSATLGVDRYADWLVVSAIPSILVVSDLGLGAAGGVRLTQLVAGEKLSQGRALFRGYSWVALGLVGFVAIVAELVVAALPIRALDDIVLNSVLAGWVLTALASTLIEGAFRAFDEFSLGVGFLIAIRLTEAVALWAIAATTASLVLMALTQLVMRLLGTLIMGATFKWRRRGNVAWRIKDAVEWTAVASLWRPSLGFLAGPSGQLVLVQGSTLIGGAYFSSAGLVGFNSCRVVVGLIRQAGQALSFAVMPDVTRAGTLGQAGRVRHLARRLIFVLAAVLLPVSGLVAVAGPFVLPLAIGQTVTNIGPVLFFLLVYALGETVWTVFLMLRMASNSHLWPALGQLLTAIVVMVVGLNVGSSGPLALAACFTGYGVFLALVACSISRRGTGVVAGASRVGH